MPLLTRDVYPTMSFAMTLLDSFAVPRTCGPDLQLLPTVWSDVPSSFVLDPSTPCFCLVVVERSQHLNLTRRRVNTME
jgi:hypothetical protein